jgi:hypothetical protein
VVSEMTELKYIWGWAGAGSETVATSPWVGQQWLVGKAVGTELTDT